MTAYKINENHVFLCLNQKEDKNYLLNSELSSFQFHNKFPTTKY